MRPSSVDHAADRVRSVEQRAWSAHHFDALRRQRLERDRVVDAGRRRIEQPDAVLQDADAIAIEAADDRTARVRTVVAGVDADKRAQHLAQRRLLADQQRLADEDRHRRDHVEQFAAERIGGDDDRRHRLGQGNLRAGNGRGERCERGRAAQQGVEGHGKDS
ncbi:MAG: hypothetical protein IPF73_18945 [Betaproteobacteria bacterium]|nr:hypothetical protein [Betaproteobacteria bacterium]